MCTLGRMAGKKREEPKEDDVSVPKFAREMLSLTERLHDTATERDVANNRQLFYDQVCTLILIYYFNPVVSSLRAIEQASGLKKVQRMLGCGRASLGSLSEAMRVFDADLLLPIIGELSGQLKPLVKDARLNEIRKTITLVDGSLLKALPLMAEASLLTHETGKGSVKWRLHTQFDLLKGVPDQIEPTRDNGKENDERAVLSRFLEGGKCYVGDRGYLKTALFNQIHNSDSNYVIRIKDKTTYDVIENRELSSEAKELRVVSDQIIEINSQSGPDHKTRLIVIEKKAHSKHHSYKKTGPACDGFLRILTDMIDVPAEIIAILYEHRWQVEIFFRYFKNLLGCRHLLARNENGIKIQVYCGIIACLLISLWTGRKPTLRTHEMICYYLTGLADEDELIAHLESLKKAEALKQAKK